MMVFLLWITLLHYLSKMPKTFGLSELKKGYFPHLFNTPDNQKFVGYYRASEYYGVDFISVDE
jgi:hypothetical protein